MKSSCSRRFMALVACTFRMLTHPFASGFLLLFIAYADNIQYALPWGFQPGALVAWLQSLSPILWWHLLLATLRQLNQALNTLATNSWRYDPSHWVPWLCRKEKNWQGEIAVVTGGSSGIGKTLVEKMVEKGITVAVLDIQELPKTLQNEPHVRFYHCDVSKKECVSTAAGAVRKELGHPSILVNNAGIGHNCTILDTPEAFLRQIFGVNCMALWLTTQQFLPDMIKHNRGHVVTVASMSSFVALPAAADYAATKAGALAFHEALTTELRHFYKAPGVLTTVVHPDFVRTPLIENVRGQLESAGAGMLSTEDVVEEIMASLQSNTGGQVVVPRRLSIITSFRAWPGWIQHGVRDSLGRRVARMK